MLCVEGMSERNQSYANTVKTAIKKMEDTTEELKHYL